MKKNLVTVPSGIQHYKPYVLRLWTVFLCLVFCNLQLSAAVTDSATTSAAQSSVIYISPGTQIMGASEFSNARIVELSDAPQAKKTKHNQAAKSAIVKEVEEKKETLDRAAELVQEKVNQKIKTFYTSDLQNTKRLRLAKSHMSSAAVSGNLHFHFSKAILSSASSKLFVWQKFEQSLYPFNLNLQSCKFTSSSLRGPPTYL